jgi:hypothetical protein
MFSPDPQVLSEDKPALGAGRYSSAELQALVIRYSRAVETQV